MYLCLQFWSSSLTTKCYHDRIEKTPFAEGALRNIMIARKKNMKKCHILQILSTLEWLWMKWRKCDGFFTIVHRNITMYSTSLNAFVGIRKVRLNPEISYGRWSIQCIHSFKNNTKVSDFICHRIMICDGGKHIAEIGNIFKCI